MSQHSRGAVAVDKQIAPWPRILTGLASSVAGVWYVHEMNLPKFVYSQSKQHTTRTYLSYQRPCYTTRCTKKLHLGIDNDRQRARARTLSLASNFINLLPSFKEYTEPSWHTAPMTFGIYYFLLQETTSPGTPLNQYKKKTCKDVWLAYYSETMLSSQVAKYIYRRHSLATVPACTEDFQFVNYLLSKLALCELTSWDNIC